MQKVDKAVDKMDDVSNAATYPKYFFDTGSCIINQIISGDYKGGYPSGRMTMLAGPSGSGKSFLLGNAIREALNAGYGVFVLDSENALDEEYLQSIGVDINHPLFNYKGVNSIDSATKVFATFFNAYEDAPEDEQIPYLMCLDSLDQLLTSSQEDKGHKGESAGDMGQKAKQLKQFQSIILHRIKPLNVAVVATKQPYMNQDGYTNKQKPYIITESLRFAYTQILLVTNKYLKNPLTNEFSGINLQVFGEKTRLTKPYQKCIVEVPYDEGMDWYSGVLQAAESVGVVKRNGAWYSYGDVKFQKKTFNDHKHAIFEQLNAKDKALNYEVPKEDLAD